MQSDSRDKELGCSKLYFGKVRRHSKWLFYIKSDRFGTENAGYYPNEEQYPAKL